MSIDFSSNRKRQRWFNKTLSSLAAEMEIVNHRRTPSIINLLKLIAFAYIANKEETIRLLLQVTNMGREEYRKYVFSLNALRGPGKQGASINMPSMQNGESTVEVVYDEH